MSAVHCYSYNTSKLVNVQMKDSKIDSYLHSNVESIACCEMGSTINSYKQLQEMLNKLSLHQYLMFCLH